MNPFLKVIVVPVYGKLQGQIFWSMAKGFEIGRFTIRKSGDGINNWRDIGIVDRGDTFTDPELLTDGKLDLEYYQVILQKNGRRYDSSIISTIGEVTREEFGMAHHIMQEEYKKLRKMTRIHICKLRLEGPYCTKCMDPDTHQRIGTALCQHCYGTGFTGGFWPPVISYMQPVTQSAQVRLDSADGAGSTDPVNVKSRMLAFPQLVKEDLIVDASSDSRYLVETQNTSSLMGKIPLVSMVDLVLLRRTDVRYKFSLE